MDEDVLMINMLGLDIGHFSWARNPPTPPPHPNTAFKPSLCYVSCFEKQYKLCETAFDKLLFLLASLYIQQMLDIKSSGIYFFLQRSF